MNLGHFILGISLLLGQNTLFAVIEPSEINANLVPEIKIGIVIEQSAAGSISAETKEYFKVLDRFIYHEDSLFHVVPVPLNAFISERGYSNGHPEKKEILSHLVQKDLRGLSGVIIPGDDFNFPPFRISDDPLAEVMRYSGQKQIHDEETIYGMTAREFYRRNPDHLLNPHGDSLVYEGMLISLVYASPLPMLTACHGTLMYGYMNQARFVAGIEGHADHNVVKVKLRPDSKISHLLGEFDNLTLHYHTVAISLNGLPNHLIASGWDHNLVEILEDKNYPAYLGFQGHPELSPDHPAINLFVKQVLDNYLRHTHA